MPIPEEYAGCWGEADVIERWCREGKLTLSGQGSFDLAHEVTQFRIKVQDERDQLQKKLNELQRIVDTQYAELREKILNEKSGELVRLHRIERALERHQHAHAVTEKAIRLALEGKGPDGRLVE